MNAVDKIQLELFLSELARARVLVKDSHVDALIRRALGQQPDATYLLVQRVLQLESALCGARAAATSGAEIRALRIGDRPPEEVERRNGEPWWRQPVDILAGTAVLLQSTAYLVGARASGESVRAS